MSEFSYSVNADSSVAALAIYDAKIYIDPIYKYYNPNNGVLSDNNSTLTISFNIEITDIYEAAYLREIVTIIFTNQPATVPRNIAVQNDIPTVQHDYYLGFNPASEWLNETKKIKYNCFGSDYNVAVWELTGTTFRSLSMALPTGTNLSFPSLSQTLIDAWSTTPDISLYKEVEKIYNKGIISPQINGGYRISIIFQIEQLINLQQGAQSEIQFIRNGTDIIRRLLPPIQIGTSTLLTSTFQINGAFNFNHANLGDTYTIVFANNSSADFNYKVSSYSLYNLSMEFLG